MGQVPAPWLLQEGQGRHDSLGGGHPAAAAAGAAAGAWSMERGPGSRAGRRLLAPPGRHAQRLGPQLSGRSRPRPQWLQGPLQPRAGAPPFATLSGSRASTCLGPGHNRPPSGSQGTGTSALSSSLNSLKLLFAGALSAVVSRTCVAPLERVKMELVLKQNTGGALSTAASVFKAEGLAGFWRGNALNVLRTAPFKAVNFFCFDSFHQALVSMSGSDGNRERFTAGAMAGITATVVCFPLDVVRTRLLSRVHGARYGTNPFRALAGILKHEGMGALYTGCLPAVIGMAPAGAVFYGVYDLLKHNHLQTLAPHADGSPPVLPSRYTLLYGALAGACSELMVYPLEVLRRRMQMHSMATAASHGLGTMPGGRAAAMTGQAAKLGAAGGRSLAGSSKGIYHVMAILLSILRTEGARGLYTGLAPNILQVLPSAALSYYTYDTCKQLFAVL